MKTCRLLFIILCSLSVAGALQAQAKKRKLLAMDDSQKADFLSFIREDGKGFLGAHSANDTFYKWPAYGEMIGGYFDLHPWNQFQAPIIVEDRSFPGMQKFPPAFTIHDEIYQAKDFSRERVRVLMRVDADKVDLRAKGVHRTDKDFAVTWARNYGKGRVFYCGLGHREEVWDRPDVRKMWLEAIKWAMGLIPGDATPRPMPQSKPGARPGPYAICVSETLFSWPQAAKMSRPRGLRTKHG